MDSLLNAFRNLGPGRILALFVGIAAVIAISSLVINRAQTPGMALLYGGLNAQETSRIADTLASQNIAYETKGESAIYVPADKVGELRLQLAGQGMVGGSAAGYELFDNQSTFGTTNFVSNLNAKRALEGELARTIGTLPAVTAARVHIVLPKQNLFSREQVTPSAAVALNLGNRTLQPEQVQSIAQLVAASVPNLSPANITVIDQRGTTLYNGAEQTGSASSAETIRRKLEKSYEDSLTGMLERVIGSGKVAVRVTADVNLDKITEQSELFDPTQQVVRSEQTVESTGSTSSGGNGGLTGVQGNTPGGEALGGGSGGGSNEARTETTTNYEISKTMRNLERNGGEVKKLSVAVLVEGKTTPSADAAQPAAYTPLTDDEKVRLRTLVETAIGFDSTRGDKVEIVDMPFSPQPEVAEVAEPFMSKDQMINLAQYALMAVALAIVGLFVVKPALTTLNTALASSAAMSLPPMPAMDGSQASAAFEGEGSNADIKAIQGKVKESAVKKVNEVVDQYPEESLSVVRGWMSGSATPSENS